MVPVPMKKHEKGGRLLLRPPNKQRQPIGTSSGSGCMWLIHLGSPSVGRSPHPGATEHIKTGHSFRPAST
jgi:hypothetical protein